MIKKLYTLMLLLILSGASQSQIIYSDDFTAGSTGWQLGQGGNFDFWIVNNVYSCSSTSPNTPDQGGGNYLHVYDDLDPDYCACSLFAGTGSGGLVYATMTSGVSTTALLSCSIGFDWVCMGQTGNIVPSYGLVDYSTDGGVTWTNLTSPLARYSGSNAWANAIITSTQVPGLLNHPDLRLRFGFNNSGYGTNPAFAVDNVIIQGIAIVGMEESTANSKLNIYPNPGNGIFMIDASTIKNQNVQVKVINALGQIVKEETLDRINGNKKIPLNLQSLPSGIYQIQLQTESEMMTKQIVVN